MTRKKANTVSTSKTCIKIKALPAPPNGQPGGRTKGARSGGSAPFLPDFDVDNNPLSILLKKQN